MNLKFLNALILYTLFSTTVHAKTIYYGSKTEPVSIVYGGPTIFRFNEEVKTISQAAKFSIKPTDQKDPSYSVLSITPRFTKGTSLVSFILSNGAVVNLKISILSKAHIEKTDSFYDFEPNKNLIASNDDKESNVTDLDLMKSMIRWKSVVGYKERAILRDVQTGKKGLSTKLVRIYTGPKYTGYIFKIKNNSRKKYSLDIKNLTLGRPNVSLLSQVDQKVLKPRGVTFLRVVAKSTSVYYKVNLPFGDFESK